MASLTGGGLLLVVRRFYQGELRSALLLPWRLWAGPMLCFVLYGVAWPWAVACSRPDQVFGVNLINYLWPVLTVLFGVWLVPGVRLSSRLLLALFLTAAGLAFANWHAVGRLAAGGPDLGGGLVAFLPYALAVVAAVTWALYSALLSRWKGWAGSYVTSPLGFIIIGLVSASLLRIDPQMHASASGTLLTLLYGAGPLAVGYLFWELGLARAKVETLGLMAAATPVLSTLWLCLFLQRLPGLDLGVAALLVSAGVVLSLES